MIRAENARANIIPLTREKYMASLTNDGMGTEEEWRLLKFNDVVAKGNIKELRTVVLECGEREVDSMINGTSYYTYDGNSLNVAAYWNTIDVRNPDDIFMNLLYFGATIKKDYYDNYPWDNRSDKWVYMYAENDNYCSGLARDYSEFDRGYSDTSSMFGFLI